MLFERVDNYYKIAADGINVPNLSVTTNLFHKEFSAKYNAFSGVKMFEGLEILLKEYSLSCSGKAEYQKRKDVEHYLLVI